jgi:3-oxoacyl-[acyl-carrier-protein] synthase II
VRKPRVVITGLGAIAPNGIGKDAFWQALRCGRSGIDRITRFDASEFPCQIAGEVRDFDPTPYMASREAKRLPRAVQFGIASAKMACEDAGIQVTPENAERVGVCFGTSVGKSEIFETEHTPFLARGIRAIHPSSLIHFSPHSVSSQVAMALGGQGVCGTLSSGCTVALDAIQWASQQLYFGRARVMVVGGSEAILNPFGFGTVCALGVLTNHDATPQEAPRPFDLHRDGIVLSEAAGALVLETWEHAQARGAHIYAEVIGGGSMRYGGELLRCDISGADMAHVMEAALIQSGLPRHCIDHINAHGVGLCDYDQAETSAIKTVFGKHAYNIPVSSIKSMIGQPFAAAGALQVVASCLTLQNDMIPPTINYTTPDPYCDLDYVPNHARRARVRTILVHAHGIGGSGSALVLERG